MSGAAILTGKIEEMVPRVWPGVRYIAIVVSPRVSFCPSVATTSRVGLAKLTRSVPSDPNLVPT